VRRERSRLFFFYSPMTDLILQQLAAPIARRIPLADKLEAYRLCDGAGDQIPGLYLDRFGTVAIAHLVGDERLIEELEQELRHSSDQICELCGCSTLYLRAHRNQAKQTAESEAALISGPGVAQLQIFENGVSYIVRPADQVNAGLFLDTRDLRRWLIANTQGKKVLNLFAFTGSLGIAAWFGGASSVTQVDIAKGILRWARENWVLNGGDDPARSPMRFIEEDSGAFLDREARRQVRGNFEPYDLVLLDPPSFGSSKGVRFSILSDLPALIGRALRVVKPGGELFVTANSRELTSDRIMELIVEQAAQNGIEIQKLESVHPPSCDFTSQAQDSLAIRGARVSIAP